MHKWSVRIGNIILYQGIHLILPHTEPPTPSIKLEYPCIQMIRYINVLNTFDVSIKCLEWLYHLDKLPSGPLPKIVLLVIEKLLLKNWKIEDIQEGILVSKPKSWRSRRDACVPSNYDILEYLNFDNISKLSKLENKMSSMYHGIKMYEHFRRNVDLTLTLC